MIATESKLVKPVTFGLSPVGPLYCRILNKSSNQDKSDFVMHYALEMVVVLEGKLEGQLEGVRCKLEPGSIWFSGAYEPHRLKVLSAECKYLVVNIFPTMLTDRFFPGKQPVQLMSPFLSPHDARPTIPSTQHNKVISMATEIESYDAKNSLEKATQINLVEQLILFSLKFSPSTSVNTSANTYYRTLLPAIELAFNQSKPVSTKEAVKACSMNESAFSRRFKSQFGLTFNKFSLRNRLHLVARALGTTDMPIKVIVMQWGFTDESHLNRLFKQHYQVSPAKYRTMKREGVSS